MTLLIVWPGPLVDLANNQRVHDGSWLSSARTSRLPLSAGGVTCLAFARDMNERRSIIWGNTSPATA
ncbi:MAG: hypothetical protein U1F42_03470 [Candidatus Competibacteraceae bacterium]